MPHDPSCSFRLAAAMLLTTLVVGGAADAAGTLEPFGLGGRVVTSLGAFGSLYAGTIGDGVFRRDLAAAQADWVPLGLTGRTIRAVYPHASGPLGLATTVGLQNDPQHADSALIYCSCDQAWSPADSGMTRADISAIWSLDGFPSPAICGETFAGAIGSAGGVWRRPFTTLRWEHVLDLGFGVCNVVHANPRNGDVWAGGETTIMAPWIARSTDRGDTWQVVYPDLGGDNACNAIAVHPDDPAVAYAGMEGPLIKTTDGGATWQATGLTGTPAYLYGVALDSGAPSHLLVGGRVQPNHWALWESFDGGDNWIERGPPTPAATGISSVLADPYRAGTFYLATFGDGVWRYRHAASDVDGPGLPSVLAIGRVYPNPFRNLTTIEFLVPPSLAGMPAVFSVYDVRGGLVRELVNRVAAVGIQRMTWDGVDSSGRPASTGVYYGQLRVGPDRRAVRLALLR